MTEHPAHSDAHSEHEGNPTDMSTHTVVPPEDAEALAARAAATAAQQADAARHYADAAERRQQEEAAERHRKEEAQRAVEARTARLMRLAQQQRERDAREGRVYDDPADDPQSVDGMQRQKRIDRFKADLVEANITEIAGWAIADVERPDWRSQLNQFVHHATTDGDVQNLILFGPVGTGKSTSALAVGWECVQKGLTVRFVRHADFLTTLRTRAYPNGLTEAAYRRRYVGCDLLILDDLGSTKARESAASEFTTAETVSLIDARVNSGRRTIVTTNYTTDQIAALFSPRVTSRLGQRAMGVVMDGPDRRNPITWG